MGKKVLIKQNQPLASKVNIIIQGTPTALSMPDSTNIEIGNEIKLKNLLFKVASA